MSEPGNMHSQPGPGQPPQFPNQPVPPVSPAFQTQPMPQPEWNQQAASPPPFPPYQPPKKKHTGRNVTLAVVGVVVGLCGIGIISSALGGGSGKKSTAAVQEQSPVAQQTKVDGQQNDDKKDTSAERKTPGLNTAVRDGKFEFVVSKVACGQKKIGGQYLNKTAQGQFCLVTLSVKNIGSAPQTFFDNNQTAKSTDGAEYHTDSSATLYLNEKQSTWINEINPGNSINGTIVFDVPNGTKIAELELHDSAFSGGVTIAVA